MRQNQVQKEPIIITPNIHHPHFKIKPMVIQVNAQRLLKIIKRKKQQM
jgi:hypothetical protein